MPELVIAGLGVCYGGISATHDVSLTAAPGRITALIGANGAGKSSTVRAVLGLIPYTGSVTLDGRPLDALRPPQRVRRGIALVPEGRGMFGPLTVRENLLMGAHVRRGSERLDRLPDVLSLFPMLADRLDQDAAALSGGQQQMLAVGRALMADPEVIVLDEPSMGLAPTVCTDLFGKLRRIADGGTTVLVSDQNARRVLRVADDVYLLRQGRLVFGGLAADLNDQSISTLYFGSRDDSGTDHDDRASEEAGAGG